MKRKMTLQKIAIAMVTGVVGMSGALLNPFSAEATGKNSIYCNHNITLGSSGMSNFCKEVSGTYSCKYEVGLGSSWELCGEC